MSVYIIMENGYTTDSHEGGAQFNSPYNIQEGVSVKTQPLCVEQFSRWTRHRRSRRIWSHSLLDLSTRSVARYTVNTSGRGDTEEQTKIQIQPRVWQSDPRSQVSTYNSHKQFMFYECVINTTWVLQGCWIQKSFQTAKGLIYLHTHTAVLISSKKGHLFLIASVYTLLSTKRQRVSGKNYTRRGA